MCVLPNKVVERWKKMKKVGIVSVLLTLTMVLGLGINVCASEPNAAEGQVAMAEAQVLPEGIYEGEQLQMAAEILGYEMVTEDGYVLESISVSLTTAEDSTEIYIEE